LNLDIRDFAAILLSSSALDQS